MAPGHSALDHLRALYDLVVIEGAGSPVELNLRTRDLVNMAVARYAQAPVLLVGDIACGGIFAQLLGTLWLFTPEEQALVQGLVVNKFRGDLAFFHEGIRILEERSALPVLGVIPFVPDLRLPEEDAAALDTPVTSVQPEHGSVDIAIRLPHIANFDDFAPLAAEAVGCLSAGTGISSLSWASSASARRARSRQSAMVRPSRRSVSGTSAGCGGSVPESRACRAST